MNLDAEQKFLSRLTIKDRDSHRPVKFIFKYNQQQIHNLAKKQQEEGKPIRIIVDKSRRVGVSSWSEGLLFCHCLALPGADALVAAHKFDSSKKLFEIPKNFVHDLPFLNIEAIERTITFPHPVSASKLQVITAGKDTSGRGYTLSALHLSEAAHIKNADILSSLLPALSNHKDTICIIESTPNGMEGDGEAFYQMCRDAWEGKSEYAFCFLSWINDPACVADPMLARDAPIDDEEKELIKMGLTKAQLAWRRLKIASPECGGSVEMFHQEFPTNAEESFVVSGLPAFEMVEINWAKKKLRKPIWQGFIERTMDGSLNLRKHPHGDLRIWHNPVPGHWYYIGLDAARGDEGRDFSAMVCWDATTGEQAFTYNGYVVPEVLACYANSLGRHYNRAMINGDLTGGYGSTSLFVLRDLLRYPNLYRWKGKDDKIVGSSTYRALWLDITQYIRNMLFETFRASLREAEKTDGELGVTIHDELLAKQIALCTRKETYRIDVRKGHDDILFAAMIGHLAMKQWAPPRKYNPSRSHEDEIEQQAINKVKEKGHEVLDDVAFALQRHYEKISRYQPPREWQLEQ